MKFFITFCLTFLLIPAVSLANGTPKSEKIIVTLPPLSGLVSMLLPSVKSTCLLSAGADPHHFQPSPKQVDLLSRNNLLIRASRDDQGWPIRAQQSHIIDLWAKDNHAWLQFTKVQQALPLLAKALTDYFPQHKQTIQLNLSKSLQSVTNIEQAWEIQLNKIRQHGVFMQHPAWHDLLESKNIPIWSVLESHQHGHEHGPHHLEDALNTLKQHPDAILLGSKRHSNRSLEWLHNHESKSNDIIKLDALGNCNQPWDELMQHNLEVIQNSL